MEPLCNECGKTMICASFGYICTHCGRMLVNVGCEEIANNFISRVAGNKLKRIDDLLKDDEDYFKCHACQRWFPSIIIEDGDCCGTESGETNWCPDCTKELFVKCACGWYTEKTDTQCSECGKRRKL